MTAALARHGQRRRPCTPPAAGPAASSRSPARPLAAALGARPSEVVFTAGGTEADNLAVKGLYWARRAADPRRRPRPRQRRRAPRRARRGRTGSAEHEGAEVEWLPVDAVRPRAPGRRCAAALAATPTTSPWSRVMWANNEVGTVQPVARAGRGRRTSTASRCTPTPCRPSASSRSTSPPPALDAMTVTGHKIGGPLGVGALLLGRGRRPYAAAARRRPGARRALRHARRARDRRLRGRRESRVAAPAGVAPARRRPCATT